MLFSVSFIGKGVGEVLIRCRFKKHSPSFALSQQRVAAVDRNLKEPGRKLGLLFELIEVAIGVDERILASVASLFLRVHEAQNKVVEGLLPSLDQKVKIACIALQYRVNQFLIRQWPRDDFRHPLHTHYSKTHLLKKRLISRRYGVLFEARLQTPTMTSA